MKIAVASSGRWLESNVDFHTGRAACFIVYNTDDESFEVFDNWKCTECLHWAGLKTADSIIGTGARTVIVRNIGPNTFRKFVNAEIDVFYTEEIPVVRAIRLFRENALNRAHESNCTGHDHIK